MTRLTGAEAIVKSLRLNGVDTIFGLPGGQLDHLFDAMYKEGDALRVIGSRHEQGAGYMAYGYAKSTGRVGVYTVVPGPGLLNSSAALCTAWANYAPVLCVAGQVVSHGIDSGYGHLHEIDDQLGLIRHLTKWAERIESPEQAPGLVREAFRQLQTGCPRPVEIEMAMDVMGEAADVTLLDAESIAPPPVDQDLIESAARVLGRSQRPLIVVGAGALDAFDSLLAVAQILQAPVVAQRKGRGVIDERHYLSQVLPAGHELWGQADAVLAVGTRLKTQLCEWGTDSDMQIIRIDINPDEIDRIHAPAVGIVGDADVALRALHDALGRHAMARASREDELTALKSRTAQAIRAHCDVQMAYLDVIREVLPDDGFFVDEVTQIGFASWFGFPVYAPRHFITAGHQGTLGFGYATALGVVAGNPGKKVISISGDGGFMFNVQEIATAVQQQFDLVTIIFNDNRFGNVQRQQDDWFGGRRICSDLVNPDFVKLAEAFGAAGYRADEPQALKRTLERALAAGGPCLIEVPVTEPMPTPWQFLIMEQNRRERCR